MSGSLATTERLAAGEMVEGIEVPVIGTVGDFPEPAHRHVVNVTADGRIVLEGVTLTFDRLRNEECRTLIDAVKKRDGIAIRGLATKAGIDWTAGHVGGIGALDDAEVSTEGAVKPGIKGPGALSGDGYEGVQPMRPAGT